ncbi:7-cyano-7-deazaguanine synthase [Candidatus Vecturithrix granuli]|uniref:7-cyano-7-deazaguanine synthase n=1 Tax=Vecturithrix granuli TaxID=1499967 RepID=A0A081C3Z3_VECG1|nr:7-cyano-7-deazaguanine synthase [Candidatus Vecturithrix granuli]
MNTEMIYEDILMKKRGFVSKWPENKCAVMILSGGLDSVITCAWLLEEKQFILFPLHIQRGQTNAKAELNSVKFFEKFFMDKYPEKFFPVECINVHIPPIEFKTELGWYMKEKGYPLRDPILLQYAVQYAYAIHQRYQKYPKTIFCALGPKDPFPHTKLVSLRSTTISVCQNLDDWDWLITSPNIDVFLREQAFDKPDEIRWAIQHNIPIEKTISCYQAQSYNCGQCANCKRRQEAFKIAGIKDPTHYETL